MFLRQASAGATNTIIEYLGTDYINFTTAAIGSVFTRFAVDVSVDVTNISTRAFDYTQQVQCNDTDYITDENGSVYFAVLNYTQTTTARPARS